MVVPTLPPEVMCLIIGFSTRRELKNLRLADQACASLAEPHLFDTMTLVPYVDCLTGFVDLMATSAMAHHVKKVVYDCRYRGSVQWTRRIDSYLPLPPQHRVYSINRDEAFESALLVKCLATLPAIQDFVVREQNNGHPMNKYWALPLDDAASYFSRCPGAKMGRNMVVTTNRDAIRENPYRPNIKIALLAIATASSPLIQFSAYLAGLSSLSNFYPAYHNSTIYVELMKKLSKLTLDFSSQDNIDVFEAENSLACFIQLAPNLEELRLHMCDRIVAPAFWYQEWLHSLARLMRSSEMGFPRLKKLDLGYMACLEDDLMDIVTAHRKTITAIHLESITLLPDFRTRGETDDEIDADPTSHSCWVRLFRRLRRLALSSLTLAGTFSNTCSQFFTIQGPRVLQPGLLYSRMQQWVCGKEDEPCPIDEVAIKLDFSGDEIIPRGYDAFGGDDSWLFIPAEIALGETFEISELSLTDASSDTA